MGCAGSRPSQLIPSLGNHHHHPHHMNSPQKGFILFNAKTIEYLQANELEIKEKLKKRCEVKLNKVLPQSTSSKSLLNNAKRTLLFNTSTSTHESANLDEDLATKSDANLQLNNSTLKNEMKMSAIDAAVDYVLKYALNDFDIENFKSSNHLSMKQIRKDIMKKNQSVSSLSKLNNSMNTQGTLPNSQKNKMATLVKGHDASMYKQALNAAIDEFGLFVQENFIVINEFDKTHAAGGQGKNEASEESEKADPDTDAEAYKLKEALEVARHNFYKGKISMVCLTKAGGYVVKEVKEQPSCEAEGLVVLATKNSREETIIPKINVEDADSVENKLREMTKSDADVEAVTEENKEVELTESNEPTETAVSTDVEKEVDEPATEAAVMPTGPIDIKKEIALSILNVGEVLAKTIDYYSNDPEAQEIKDLIELSAKQSRSQKNTPEIKRKNVDITSEQPESTEEPKVEPKSEPKVEPKVEPPTIVVETIEEEAPKSPSSSLVSPSSSSASSLTEAETSSPSKHKEDVEETVLPAEPTTPVPPPELNMAYEKNDPTIITTTNSTPRPEHVIESQESPENDGELGEDEEEETNVFFETKTDYTVEENVVLMKCDTKSASSVSDILSNDEVLIEKVTEESNVRVEENPVVFRTVEVSSSLSCKRMSLDEELFYHLEEVDKKVKYMNETCSEDEGGDDDDDLDDENFDYDESVELENGNDERLFHPRTPAKIKSEVRNNRAVDLHEEIKQISNVIQDLVQTINVRNSTNQTEVINKSSLDNSDEDGSQNSGSGGDCKTKSYHYNRNSNGSHNSGSIVDRKSIGSNRRSVGNNQSLNSSIPVSVTRQKTAKRTSTANELELESVNSSFADNDAVPGALEATAFNTSGVNKSASSQRFRSKLPVKK